ncbi:MAG: hypothetical protein ACT4O3_05495 [Elusimicrobiota bacterium]
MTARLSRGVAAGGDNGPLWKYLKYSLILAVGGVIVLHGVAVWLPYFFLSTAFLESQNILKILSAALFFLYPNYLLSTALTLRGRQAYNAWVAASCVVFNVAANFYAIPRWGAVGAAWTTVATELLIFTSSCLLLGRAKRLSSSVEP